jgi:Glycosyl hydrolase family 63 C-terminal domain
MYDLGGEGVQLWDEEDGFFYDVLQSRGGRTRLRVRSLVGLIPLFAVETLEPEIMGKLHGFRRRLQWFMENRPHLRRHITTAHAPDRGTRRLLSIVGADQLPRMLQLMLDESEFLSPYGIRSVSRVHRDRPFVLSIDGMEHRVSYEPAESSSALFGGNSNWRGPVWFPVNYLLIESLQKFHHFFGDRLRVPCPTGSTRMLNLWQVALEISQRLTRIFLPDAHGRRAVYGGTEIFQTDPHWRDLLLFYEYFHGDNGAGIGASHQTGWTALVAKLLQQSGEA